MIGGIFQTILWFLLALIILVTIHEFGHFYVARRCGVKVLRFSVGFGNPLFSWRDKHGTEFSVAAIPLGGYVKMLDEREGEVAPEELPYAFTQKSVWQRMAIVSAGPLANYVLAVLLFWLLFIPPRVDYIPVVGEVAAESIAERAGLEAGQEIIAVDGVETPTRQAVARQLIERLGESGSLSFAYKYPDRELVYTSDVVLDNWLRGAEEPDPLEGIGLTFQGPPVLIDEVQEGSPAAAAGLRSGDLVLAADGTEVVDWYQWVTYVSARAGQEIRLDIERGGRELSLTVVPRAEEVGNGETIGRVGVTLQQTQNFVREFNFTWYEAFGEAVSETWDTAKFVLISVKKLIMGEISTKNLSGPITIAKVAGSSGSAGWMSFVSFLALLSVSLGVFNLLPIPVLDGGHLAYYIAEAIKGSPVSERVQVIGYQVGLFLIVGVMLLALYNDILRL